MKVKAVIVDELPEGCGSCPLEIDPDPYPAFCSVDLTKEKDTYWNKRPDWCPLVLDWLPYPENKPVEEDYYFVTLSDECSRMLAYWSERQDCFWDDMNNCEYQEIIAYRPLPEPYQPESENKE